ncbi:uncharacterized protein LOC106138040 [Amyelois transitella]|uniref:uncharacterized protein LOC106138040 n=1 Tax=Amyelois transitella TaxID=680683 RepID=UPI00298FC503|nr:uncharacterized protein LOC106138040 [Amyelois transitella]
MVNYCCVSGCGRNSRCSKQLNYYSLPKERSRQIEWFKAAGREDLIVKSQEKLGYRFCSRHFEPNSVKNKHLKPDAVPTLYLPGSTNQDDSDSEVLTHEDVLCNKCNNPVVGFRYKCLTCPDYDLCSICETVETHSKHYMLRISRPDKDDTTEKILKKLRDVFAEVETRVEDSSDDEPITKYVKNYDSGIDLSEDLKSKIRKEVTRVLSVKKKRKNKTAKKREAESSRAAKRQKNTDETEGRPEMVFVDGPEPEVKTEHDTQPPPAIQDVRMEQQPLIHVKISEDFNDLMIEMPASNVYKYI